MDTLTGTDSGDTLRGSAAAELILGDPADTRPGPGNLVLAGGGDDLVFAGYGSDTVLGGAGNDTLFGSGTTQAPGASGAFYARDDLADRLDGGAGDDVISGAGGDDILLGGLGDDRLMGDWGNDRLVGGAGADTLRGGLGADRLIGGEDADVFVFGITSAPAAFGFDAGRGAGRDVVLDFAADEDLLRFEGIAAEAVSWTSRPDGAGTTVRIAAPDGTVGEVWLPGVAALDEGDFVFA
ncbi:calcium-binding protein [Falsiroseomonas sp. CW058]|uniref:calcium-binding protein n=1 Tax=Falsiroseomonas sp. CW058 TaxID=3388664 RepID=UPI003D31202D